MRDRRPSDQAAATGVLDTAIAAALDLLDTGWIGAPPAVHEWAFAMAVLTSTLDQLLDIAAAQNPEAMLEAARHISRAVSPVLEGVA